MSVFPRRVRKNAHFSACAAALAALVLYLSALWLVVGLGAGATRRLAWAA